MKNFKFCLAFVAVAAMFMTSCSKEDNPDGPDGPAGTEMVTLSFKGSLSDFTRKVETKQQIDAPISGCFENADPAYVMAGVKDSNGDWVSGGYIKIDVIPVSIDSDSDGNINYLTFESEDLELEEDDYTLEYFAVYNNNDDRILMAPRSDNDYGPYSFHNFVDFPLPQSIDLKAGTKHYQEVEVLCYDEQDVQEYGYLFFDFEELPLTYICFFGNECDDTGRHRPSHFRVKVWEYPSIPTDLPVSFTDENILVNDVNDYNNGENAGEEITQADPLCIPLPDRYGEGETWFYGEIWSIDAQGNEKLIRRGDFTDEDTKDPNFEIDGKQKYWHFREGPYCGEDSDPCLLSNVVEDWVQDFGTGVVSLTNLQTDYIDVDTNNDGDYTNADNPGVPAPFGGFLITDDPSKYYSDFVGAEAGDDGNMIVFDGAPDKSDRVIYTMETPELCAGDTYYLKMRVKDISAPDQNNARLKVKYRTGSPESGVTAGNFLIDPLVTDASSVWKTVGFTMTATEDGSMIIRIRDREDDNTGNDFAIDDIVLSNDPTVLNGVNPANINPSN